MVLKRLLCNFKMKFRVILCTIFGAILAFILRTPVPDGLTEPWKYRLLVAYFALPGMAAKMYAYFHPENEYAYIQAMRSGRDIPNYPLPSEVQGSNIRSKVTTFDGIRVRLYEPIKRKRDLLPALIYIHGGAYALGSADGSDRFTRNLAERLNMIVVSIDYRLAPEHPFPAGHNDCLRATRWLLRHANEYGVDATRIGISGESAGGHFSAAVSQVIRDDETVPDLKLQVLVYPSTQTLDFQTPSYQKYDQDFGDGGILPRKKVAAFSSIYMLGRVEPVHMKQLLSNEHITESFRKNSPYMEYINHDVIPEALRNQTRNYTSPRQRINAGNATAWKFVENTYLDPRWAPLLRKDMAGLPQALVITCGFDSLRDDGIFYAKRLESAGVDTTWKHFESAFHGVLFLVHPFWFKVGDEMTQDIVDFVTANI